MIELEDDITDFTLTPDVSTILLGTDVELAINSIADGIIEGTYIIN